MLVGNYTWKNEALFCRMLEPAIGIKHLNFDNNDENNCQNASL